MNGVPELLILELLGREERYGYAIVKAIRDATGDRVSFGEGVVYPILHSLEREGYLRSRSVMSNGRSRIYYRVTPRGRRRLAEMTSAWNQVRLAISTALGH
jgi:PadR family transcriptional regulator PadR